jgi:pilus assembly protein Flp/PilA
MVSQYVQYFMARFGLEGREEEGQGLVEYALIIVLIAVVCVGTVTLLGTAISDVFTTITSKL